MKLECDRGSPKKTKKPPRDFAIVGAFSGWMAWWLNKRQQTIQQAVVTAEKALNEKRDFNHLVNNQLDISKNIEDIIHLVSVDFRCAVADLYEDVTFESP